MSGISLFATHKNFFWVVFDDVVNIVRPKGHGHAAARTVREIGVRAVKTAVVKKDNATLRHRNWNGSVIMVAIFKVFALFLGASFVDKGAVVTAWYNANTAIFHGGSFKVD